ncbi:MAG TPA: methyltransferase domain-containing protein [Nocardioidaceae bacterium]|nr:methyltransferase domain-containing protein [Nocardioidaceae bacterium]
MSDALQFDDASLDAVLVADAWHWFAVETTIAEVRRVLKPGGWLGLVWNTVTPALPWEKELAGVDPDRKGTPDADQTSLPFPAGETEYATFPWVWEITPEHYIANLATTSAVLAMTQSQRQSTLDGARSVLARASAERRRSTLSFHHSAACARWTPAKG